ncbi:MAG: DUF6481 family protein [Alphaproteobacteria bacterium]|nr:DUF6481 family protein [Alphaproteobacteria bacterium]
MQPKQSTFSERQAASAAAKQALLAKFKPKPSVTAAEPVDHDAERFAKIEAVRQQRLQEKHDKQRAREEAAAAEERGRIEAAEAAEADRLANELSVDAKKRAERKDRKKAIKEAAKAKKDTRENFRPAAREERVLDPVQEHERYIRSLERRRA